MKQVRESHFLKGFMLFGIKYIRGQKIILMYTLFCSRKEEGLNSLIFRTLRVLNMCPGLEEVVIQQVTTAVLSFE